MFLIPHRSLWPNVSPLPVHQSGSSNFHFRVVYTLTALNMSAIHVKKFKVKLKRLQEIFSKDMVLIMHSLLQPGVKPLHAAIRLFVN